MDVVPFKDPFRVFSREQVRAIMSKLHVNAEAIAGPIRRKDYFLQFDTFDTLSDGVSYFAEAMTIELEHGKTAAVVGANVTDDDPEKSAMIAISHLCGIEYGEKYEESYQFAPYYDFLMWMEGINSAWKKKLKTKQ